MKQDRSRDEWEYFLCLLSPPRHPWVSVWVVSLKYLSSINNSILLSQTRNIESVSANKCYIHANLHLATMACKVQQTVKSVVFQVFREDFSLCLILGDIVNDPILSSNMDISVSVYGSKDQHRSSKLSAMHLQLAEGHVLGEVSHPSDCCP